MCEYCDDEKILIKTQEISDTSFGWRTGSIKWEDVCYDTNIIFVDRGFLRFAPIDDCQCLESGEKFKINFCPMCGKELKE
jgi:hypothetical protein